MRSGKTLSKFPENAFSARRYYILWSSKQSGLFIVEKVNISFIKFFK